MAVAALGVLAPVALGGCNGDKSASPSAGGGGGGGGGGGAAGSKPPAQSVALARKDLSGLRVGAEGAGTGYTRRQFGVAWKDTDHNGCGQRDDVLARDLKDVEKRGRCIVVAGKLNDPYSGKDIAFTKAKAMEVQIDHVYPLALAWRMGASKWPADRREQFANDRDNLLAVWGVPNRQKSDSGPGEWKPQKAFQCAYGVKYVEVAKKYELPVTRADHDALQDFLGHC
ncbi:HNH endonuclease family protein [Actinomadura macrotermitis]|uniref:GmrSD restriction endonucleases C-terminal domain-containing protein n=1 Tax=Actinomadura macrotermitis TaxID=2585200 RepID=A0A7K0C2D7_9ACTN|nr:HNH endonuclease family protein [Actinomadura macrotermitis]MQY07578.1 hypothetical protein [Actinomadura macrotermitis]